MGHADVTEAQVSRNADGTYGFSVTIHSQDSGWDSYADGYEVLSPDGAILGKRILQHPHETEQPFTRDLNSVWVPEDLETVTIRAHHKEFGYSGATLNVSLPR